MLHPRSLGGCGVQRSTLLLWQVMVTFFELVVKCLDFLDEGPQASDHFLSALRWKLLVLDQRQPLRLNDIPLNVRGKPIDGHLERLGARPGVLWLVAALDLRDRLALPA